jgi:predicted nucleic acid-binding protein
VIASRVIVLDTNVVSELMRSAPSQTVLGWVQAQPATQLCTTSVTLGEVRYGIARMPDGRRKDLLLAAAEDVFTTFADRVLTFDAAAAVHYAAVCRRHRAALATRNINDFDRLGLDLLDPWTDGEEPSR